MSRDRCLIILAGGKGSRLGQEKARVILKGQNLVERTISRLGFLADDTVIVCAPWQKLPPLDLAVQPKFVTDAFPGRGPLVGIYSGLSVCGAGCAFVAACDMPFINSELVSYMLELSPGYDVVIPRYEGLLEPLHAVYSRNCREAIWEMIERQEYKIDRLFENLNVKYLEVGELAKFDPEHLSFFNINTQQDLVKATELAEILDPAEDSQQELR